MSLINTPLTKLTKLKKLYWLTIASAIVMLLPSDIRSVLYLNFNDVLDGELWRVLSGHLAHLSWMHWLLNTIGVLLLQRYYGSYFAQWPSLLATLIIVSLSLSLCLIVFSQELKWYGGLSGVLIGLFYFAALQDYQHHKIFNGIAIIVMSVYIAVQQFSGELYERVTDQLTVATRAHLFGALSGIICLILITAWRRFVKPANEK